MSERDTNRIAVAVGIFAAALTVATAVLLAVGHEALTNDEGDLLFGIVIFVAGVLYTAIGLLIAVRARSVIGWFLTTVGLAYALMEFGTAYAAVGLITSPGSLPAARELGAAASLLWIFALVALCLLLLVFPDGHRLRRDGDR